MELRAVVPEDIEATVKKLQTGLAQAGFIFAENDRSYLLAQGEAGGVTRELCGSTFWARKQLSDPHPRSHSIELEGEIAVENESTAVRVELCELHGQRRHSLGGSHALESFVELFGRLLFE